jgi:hypothetical protein
MDGSRFDAWTRRRFGLTAGGATVALLAGVRADAVAKKKNKKKKKRCKKLLQPCSPGGKRKCCNVLGCFPTTPLGSDYRCCKKLNAECGVDDECCTLNCSSVLGCILPE